MLGSQPDGGKIKMEDVPSLTPRAFNRVPPSAWPWASAVPSWSQHGSSSRTTLKTFVSCRRNVMFWKKSFPCRRNTWFWWGTFWTQPGSSKKSIENSIIFDVFFRTRKIYLMKRCRQWTPHMEIIKFATQSDYFSSEKLKNPILLLTLWSPHVQGGSLDEFLWIDCQGRPTTARWICIFQTRHQTFTNCLQKGPKPKLDHPAYKVNSTTQTSTSIKCIMPYRNK